MGIGLQLRSARLTPLKNAPGPKVIEKDSTRAAQPAAAAASAALTHARTHARALARTRARL